jgi:two-component sensor histidine kinase
MPRPRLLIPLFWLVPALVATLGLQLVPIRYNPDLTFIEKFGSQVLIWEAWSAWSLLILAAGDRFPFERRRVLKAMAIHLPLCAVVMVGEIFVVTAVSNLYGLAPEYRLGVGAVVGGLRSYGDFLVVIYCAVVGADAAFRWHDAWRKQSLLATQLGADLAEAQLSALRSQLNPHFLFNALNSVVTLIGKDPEAAQNMLVRLADLLRATLALSSEQEVRLHRELELARHYLDIEQIRFNDRLTVEFSIDGDVLAAVVPSLSLQPLVENAAEHGVAGVKGPGRITVTASAADNELVLTVRDNGPGPFAGHTPRGTGVGVSNLRERIARLYGAGARLEIADAPDGGCIATLVVPLQFLRSGPERRERDGGEDSGREVRARLSHALGVARSTATSATNRR